MKKNLLSVTLVLSLVILMLCLMCSCGTSGGQASNNGEPAASSQETKDKVTPVINSIDEIGSVTLESKDKIEAAKKLYNGLGDSDKAKVTNYSVLEAAETQYEALAKAEKERIVNTYTSKFDIEHDKVENITWYQPKNMPNYIDERCYMIPYIGVQGDNAWICVRYNYTEDDWIFWENLSIVADGAKFTKIVGAFKTVRDNDGGVVWEWYDDILDVNASMDDSDIKMLEKIANSNETIVRFEGDDYYYDLTVNNADKTMIKDVLALYSAFVKY